MATQRRALWINTLGCEPRLTGAGGRERPMGKTGIRTATVFGWAERSGAPIRATWVARWAMPRTGITGSTLGVEPISAHRSPSLTGFQLAVGPTPLPLKRGGVVPNGRFPQFASDGHRMLQSGGQSWK
jgi:hypothetical protein